jgi:BCD family chlorophyll transporter-like MFS transporter
MADVITTGVWNRIMISDLGFSATPIGLLISLRYFLAPLGVWAGHMSDQRSLGGFRRLFWIWLGRGLMAISIAGLGLTTAHVARGAPADVLIWIIISLSLLAFSLGYAFSGSTFLALIYDRSGPQQRGRAVGIVWTFLLLGFTVGGILFGVLLPDNVDPRSVLHSPLYNDLEATPAAPVEQGPRYSPETLQNLFLIGAAVMAALWFFSVLGEERRHAAARSEQADRERRSALITDLKLAWQNRQSRYFFWYLALSMMFAFTQDLILEPFAADVFNMTASTTSRFAAYWGSMAILGTVTSLILSRRYKRLTNTSMSFIGVAVLIMTFAAFSLSAFAELRWLVTPGLILLGIGLGIWNVGTLGLMIDMSPSGKAGTFLGFWTLVVTFARGLGVVGGGLLRDLGFELSTSFTASYGTAFFIGAVGLGAALWALSQVRMQPVSAGAAPADTAKVLAGSMD